MLSISPHPYVWYLALIQGFGRGEAVKGASWRLRFRLNAQLLDQFLGGSVLPLKGKTPKSMQFAELQVGSALNSSKKRMLTQPCGSVEYDRQRCIMTLKCAAALFRGDSLLHGHVDQAYPSFDPPSGASRWIYSLSSRAWVDPRTSTRATKRALADKYGRIHTEWGVSAV